MSTTSMIFIQKETGGYDGIYCHYDGYPEGVGAVLSEAFKERTKVERLISLGDMSTIGHRIDPKGKHDFENREDDVCVFYGRDRGETGVDAKYFDDFKEIIDSWIQYGYVYGLDNNWYIYNPYSDGEKYQLLEDVLNTCK